MNITKEINKHLTTEETLTEKKKKYSSREISKIVDMAEDAFWGTVADLVPEASTGDLDPGLSTRWTNMNTKAVISWIAFNTAKNKD